MCISLIWVWTEKNLIPSEFNKRIYTGRSCALNRDIFWEGIKDDWIFIILTIWSELFLLNLFCIYRHTELLLVLQSQVFTLNVQAMFQAKLRNLSSWCRIILCLAQLCEENAPGLLQAGRDVHTLLHMCRLSCFCPQMKLAVCVNEISSTALQPWCSRDGDFDTLQQLLLLINIINSDYVLHIIPFSNMKVICSSPRSENILFSSWRVQCLHLKNFIQLSMV